MQVRSVAFSAVLLSAVLSLAQTQPTSAPVQPDIEQLISRLGSDSATDRDSAQEQLVDLGPWVIPALSKAATDDVDPEIRSRASAAISQIKDRDTNDVTLITLHKKDAPATDVLNEIAAQAHTQFLGYGPDLIAGASEHALTVDADRKPFWDVMTDVCGQLNMCPVQDTSGKNTLRLFTAPRNWMVQSPHQIIGPYWVGIAGLNRTRNIDLMGPQLTDDQFLVKLIVFPEPKLAVTQMSGFNLKEATDDAGNSLMPEKQQPRFPHGMRGIRQMNHVLEARLVYPKNPGSKISILRGDVTVLLAQDIQQFQVDDVMGSKKVTNPIKNCVIKASVVRQGSDLFRVSIQCTRQGLNDEQWNAMINRINNLTLEDADGQPLNVLGVALLGPGDETTFSFTSNFNRNGFPGLAANHPLNAKVGDPVRLTWKVATSSKSVTVPVTFRDLPMP